MYVRPEGRKSILIPDNYGGSAFNSREEMDIPVEQPEPPERECEEKSPSLPFGIGSEELLLLGLLLLLSQSDEGGDLIPFLLILLFFKGGK